ncbi:MAG: hypothetical protein IKD66_11345 [Solobacterium sp.]|nr:hypothetical protein [Solobacterium sp.]
MAEQKIRNAGKDLLEFDDLENVSGGRIVYNDGLNCEHRSGFFVKTTEKGLKVFREFTCMNCDKKVYSVTNAKGTTMYIPERTYRNMIQYN